MNDATSSVAEKKASNFTWRQIFKAAFPYTIPIMMAYFVLALAYGVLMESYGFGPLWAALASLLIYGGSIQYATTSLFISPFNPIEAFVLSISINARMLFCSVGLLNNFEDTGKYRGFLYFALSDESFALAATVKPPDGMDKGRFYFLIFLLNYSYWAVGSFLGGLLGKLITADTTGLDFALTAMYVAMLIDLMKDKRSRLCGVIGVACTALSLAIFGPDNMVIPALILILAVLVLGRRKL